MESNGHTEEDASDSESVDAWFDAFEQAWRRGDDPCVEEALEQVQEEHQAAALQELLRIAHLDGNFHRDEADTIDDIAEMMGFPPMYVKKVDDWVQWGLNWVWQGEDLLEEAEEML